MEVAVKGRQWATGLLVLAALSLPAQARAQEKGDVGFELGARVGYGVPLGKFNEDGADLSELIAGQFPLWLDLGIRADRVFVGGYFHYGPGLLGNEIDDECEEFDEAADGVPGADAGCHVRSTRLGAQLHYHFGAPKRPDPWLGFGAGYEWTTLTIWAEAGDEEITARTSFKGFEYLNLQGGVDFPLGPTTALGPFFTWTLSRFDSASLSCSGDCGDASNEEQDIDEKATHYWLFFGARFSFFP